MAVCHIEMQWSCSWSTKLHIVTSNPQAPVLNLGVKIVGLNLEIVQCAYDVRVGARQAGNRSFKGKTKLQDKERICLQNLRGATNKTNFLCTRLQTFDLVVFWWWLPANFISIVVMRCDAMRCDGDVMWCGVMWCDVMWYGVIWMVAR